MGLVFGVRFGFGLELGFRVGFGFGLAVWSAWPRRVRTAFIERRPSRLQQKMPWGKRLRKRR